MIDIRKILVIFVIAVLFSILVFSTIEAVYPRPQYEDYCGINIRPFPDKISQNCTNLNIPQDFQQNCSDSKGYIDYNYDSLGCPDEYFCNTCQNNWQDANEKYNLVVFIISAILGLIAVLLGMYLPTEPNSINEWVGTGFMLGGLFALFFGTARSYSDLDRIVRPIVIFIELALIIFITYKKLGDSISSNRKRR